MKTLSITALLMVFVSFRPADPQQLEQPPDTTESRVHAQVDSVLLRLAGAFWGCTAELRAAERELEDAERPGMPEAYLDRVQYSIATRTELSKREDALTEAIRVSGSNRQVVLALIALKEQEMLEVGLEFAVDDIESRITWLGQEMLFRLADLDLLPDTVARTACPEPGL